MATEVIHFRDRQPGDVYIGRAGRGEIGTFGNPIRVGEPCRYFLPGGKRGGCGQTHWSRAATLPCFKTYFAYRLVADRRFALLVEELRDKRLVCFCKPDACHGDVIAAFLDAKDDCRCAI